MRNFVVSTIVNALALWMTTIFVTGVSIVPIQQSTPMFIVTLVITAIIFGLVNGTIGRIVRFLAFPLYVLTLGLLALVVNALLLLLMSWLGTVLQFGMHVTDFWAGFWGAIVLSLVSWILGLILRPLSR